MVYELAHWVKAKCAFLWDILEWSNSVVFCVLYHEKLKSIDGCLNAGLRAPYEMQQIQQLDVDKLVDFFAQQPDEAFRFFRPHGFGKRSIHRIVKNKSFLSFVLMETHDGKSKIVGYAFMRSFANGTAYRGYMVDANHRGKGLAKMMGAVLNRVGDTLGLKMYKSISPENIASMKVTQSVCDIEILKTLDNGDYLIRCMSKPSMYMNSNIGGGKTLALQFAKLAIVPQNNLCYAA